jgi:uncharacterized protein YqhQ
MPPDNITQGDFRKPNIREVLETRTKPSMIGGQAVMEGVMMRGRTCYAIAVRNPQKVIETVQVPIDPEKRKLIKKIPVLRGIYAFGSSLAMGYRCIKDSAKMAGMDDLTEENPTKFDLWLERKFGDKLYGYIMAISMVIAVVFNVALFMVLPVVITNFATRPLMGISQGQHHWVISVSEGLTRLLVFFLFLWLMSKLKDMKRLFAYHGAEHKAIHCHELGMELTVDNAKGCSRLHKRCGTSFLFIVMIISMIFFFLVPITDLWLRIGSRVVFVPLIAGISYEILKFAGKSDSKIIGVLSIPGLYLQKLTTNEPNDGQVEVALKSLRLVLRHDGVLVQEEEETEETEETEENL